MSQTTRKFISVERRVWIKRVYGADDPPENVGDDPTRDDLTVMIACTSPMPETSFLPT